MGFLLIPFYKEGNQGKECGWEGAVTYLRGEFGKDLEP